MNVCARLLACRAHTIRMHGTAGRSDSQISGGNGTDLRACHCIGYVNVGYRLIRYSRYKRTVYADINVADRMTPSRLD